ncbi:MAG: endolytic transglycosylase MltG [Chloroflexi bacterium]|nr:MAG: endolytic transglycosylase MltG [Chloroflexota bacterium]TME15540.1 MAG: endolytic transglycosylase MltG [Chloroflexota bacterium]TME18288.1 MAG: endolytic transglycosylase MltG [Chloroflexota bacterium]
MRNLIIFLVLIGLLAYGADQAYGWYNDQVYTAVSTTSEKVAFKVSQNEDSAQIADDLYAKGLIKNREAFRLYVRLSGAASGFQAGSFVLDKKMNVPQIVDALQHAVPDQVTFTVPEGFSIARVAAKWESTGMGKAQDYLDAASPGNWQQYDFVANRPKTPGRLDNLEGYLYPDTYSLNKGATAKDLVKAQLDEFKLKFTPQLEQQAKAHGQTVDSIVVLASMVDREVQSDPNRGIVCGIYYNRLDIHNSLDVDATILYALGRTAGAQTLSNADKQAAAGSPYDTYTHAGPPPGPISNPGIAAINACVNPLQRDQHYLFYFADCKGVTRFARSEAEHEALQRQYGVAGATC